jgi:uncharacterized OB-fold protein
MIELTATSVPPLPQPSPLTRFFWDAIRQHRLEILRCDTCGHYVHYPRPICEQCLGTQLSPSPVSGVGILYSYTAVMQAFHPYFVDKLPYVLAVIELPEQAGLRITTAMVDYEEAELRVGLPVEVVFTDVAPDLTLPYFRPVRGARS